MRCSAVSALAALCALAAFAVAVSAGFFAGVAADQVIVRALIAMVACYPLGLVIGAVSRRVLHDQLSDSAGADSARSGNVGGANAAPADDREVEKSGDEVAAM